MALNVLALSNIIMVPLLAANFLRHRIKVTAVKSLTRSKWTARVTQHVNNTTYVFLTPPFLVFAYNGPAKSNPTLSNGSAALVLHSASGVLYAFPSLPLDVTHLPRTLHHLSSLWNPKSRSQQGLL